MRDREQYYEYQNKLVMRIIELIDDKVKSNNEHLKMHLYVDYLDKNTTLDRKRIKKILDMEARRLITLEELNEIAKALDLKLYQLFEDL